MRKLSIEKRSQIIGCLVEGNSIRATCRITGAAKNTVVKLLVDVGKACAKYQDKVFRDLTCQRLQCDEIWSFCYSKEKNVPAQHKGKIGYGDVWTWVAICADTKIVPSWLIGGRDPYTAHLFLQDLSSRLKNRVQLTSDGHRVYLAAVDAAFGNNIDYAMLVKIYGADSEGQKRYSPAQIIDTEKKSVIGNPNPKYISTSYAERQNLTMRMHMRRFTRLTNAFSKKVENLAYAVALHFMHYNFCRIHQTLRVTPAMEAEITDHAWALEEIVRLAD